MRYFFLLFLLFLTACGERPEKQLVVERSFEDVLGWSMENVAGAYEAFEKSCTVFERKQGNVHDNPLFGTAEQWQRICARVAAVEPGDLKALLEQVLTVYEILPEKDENPMFTGYYTPQLEGSFRKRRGYDVPLYRVPNDLLTADLGLFDEELKGERIVARAEGRKLVPYKERAEMDDHLKPDDVLLWVKDPVDAFFLHIQGSGQVVLPNGRTVFVGYAENNGLDYTAIGRTLLQSGALTKEQATMPGIKRWLSDNPQRRDDILNGNRRYIFFRQLPETPRGAMGMPLTAGYSLAVDRDIVPLGAPVFVVSDVTADDVSLTRLMLAQDVGSAIKGRVRGDIYFGAGEDAGFKAGTQRSAGRLFVFAPSH